MPRHAMSAPVPSPSVRPQRTACLRGQACPWELSQLGSFGGRRQSFTGTSRCPDMHMSRLGARQDCTRSEFTSHRTTWPAGAYSRMTTPSIVQRAGVTLLPEWPLFIQGTSTGTQRTHRPVRWRCGASGASNLPRDGSACVPLLR